MCVTSEVVEEGSQVQHSVLKGLTLLDNGVFSSQYARTAAQPPAHYGRAQARLPPLLANRDSSSVETVKKT